MIKVNNKVLCEHCFAQTGWEPCPECGFDQRTYICDPMALRPGCILAGRYAIGRVIGKGGFGVTYLAYDLKLECRVAVKEYYPYGIAARVPGSTQVSASEAKETFQSGAEKFYDEARLVAQFNGNPNIVSVHDFFYENNTVYFTMGYLDGQTLKDYLKEHGALTLGQAVYVAHAVTNALTVAHGRDVLHRDISPDNIMVCRDGTVKLLDFGAARQVMKDGSQSLSVILKQGFAPLEQYQKKGKQGPWTDIYSLGATLYHALTLDALDDPMSRLEGDEEYHSNVHGIEEGLWRVIKKATMLKSTDRYQDVFELRKDLDSLSIEPAPLTVVGDADRGWHGAAVSVHSSAVHAASTGTADSVEAADNARVYAGVCPGAAGEEESARDCSGNGGEEDFRVSSRSAVEDEIGVTMPLQEGDVGAAMPLREGGVGAAMPLQEVKDVGDNNAVKESGKAETEKARTAIGSKKYGIWSAAICLVIQSVAALMMAVTIGGPIFGAASPLRALDPWLADADYSYWFFHNFQAMAVVGGVVFFSLTPYLPIVYKNRKIGHRTKIRKVWLAGVVIQIVAGMVAVGKMVVEVVYRVEGFAYPHKLFEAPAYLGFVAALLEGVAVCVWGISFAGKVFGEDKEYEGKYHRIISYMTVLLYFGNIALNFLIIDFEVGGYKRHWGDPMMYETLMTRRIGIHLCCEFIMLGFLYLFYVKKSRIYVVLSGVTGVLNMAYWLWYFEGFDTEERLPFLLITVLTAMTVFFTFRCHGGKESRSQPPGEPDLHTH